MNRHKLETVNGRIWLTWRPNDASKTYITKFFVIEGWNAIFCLEDEAWTMTSIGTMLIRRNHLSLLVNISCPEALKPGADTGPRSD